MCTAIQYTGNGSYFGRNFDFHKSFGERVVVTPRGKELSFVHQGTIEKHYAIVGTAVMASGTALYFDGMNEHGICAAALNFPNLAVYRDKAEGKTNLASFEVIPYLLSTCRNIGEACALLERVNITGDSFSKEMSATGLHWMISDGRESLMLESMAEGVYAYTAETGVLTNPPEYKVHLKNLREQTEAPAWDYSSTSRFIQASRIRERYHSDGESGHLSLLKMLTAVSVPKGSVVKEEGVHYTKYTAVCDTERLIYHHSIYEKTDVKSVKMEEVNLDGTCYVLCDG